MADDPEYDFADYAPWIDCWQCGGEGDVSRCWDDGACFDPEYGCEECWVTCDICCGHGGWPDPIYLETPNDH